MYVPNDSLSSWNSQLTSVSDQITLKNILAFFSFFSVDSLGEGLALVLERKCETFRMCWWRCQLEDAGGGPVSWYYMVQTKRTF